MKCDNRGKVKKIWMSHRAVKLIKKKHKVYTADMGMIVIQQLFVYQKRQSLRLWGQSEGLKEN